MAVGVKGFFSYAHVDDRFGKLTNLCKDICDEYAQISGDTLGLYFDRKDLNWGDEWEKSINAGLDSAYFFIPVLTPSYYQSEYCQQELQQFSSKIDELGEPGLILPIKYIEIPDMQRDLKLLAASNVEKYQWVDFTKLRFALRDSEAYMRAVNMMAKNILNVNERLVERLEEQHDGGAGDSASLSSKGEASDFFLDSLDEFIEGLPVLNHILDGLGETMESISTEVQAGTGELEKVKTRTKNSGVRETLAVSARLTTRLQPLAEKFEAGSTEYKNVVSKVDPAARKVLSTWREHASDEKAQKMLSDANEMIGACKETKENIESYIKTLQVTMGMSRSLYKPLKQIENGALQCAGACSLVIGWESYLE